MEIRALLALLLCGALSSGCMDSTSLAEGGMTGTGITSGPITGFGSIYVNGVHYHVDGASFSRDGVSTAQDDLGVGEFVTVDGVVNADGVSGVANKVTFDSLAKGGVTALSSDGGTIGVLGQVVRTDLLTVLFGFTGLDSLQLGNIVEVSGLRTPDGMILASSITLLGEAHQAGMVLKLEGVPTQLDDRQKTFRLGGATVNYASAEWGGLASNGGISGQYVQVFADTANQGLSLRASRIIGRSISPHYGNGVYLELEGIISGLLLSASSFQLAGQTVQVGSNTRFTGLTQDQLSVGLRVEVEGTANAQGNLQARSVMLRDAGSNKGIELRGQITAIDAANLRFALEGYTLAVSNSSMLLGDGNTHHGHGTRTFSDLQVGDFVEVHAIPLTDGVWQIQRLDLGGRRH